MATLQQIGRRIVRAIVAARALPVGLLVCLTVAGCGGCGDTVAPPAPRGPDAGAVAKLRADRAIEGKQPVTDEVLRTLRETYRLHELPQAHGADGKRPARDENVTRMDLANTLVTAEGLKELKGLVNLQTLNLDSTPVTDAGLEELKGLTTLLALSLVNTKVTADGLKELKGLKNLQTLNVGVTDEVLRALGEIGLLHALWCAQAAGGARPAGDDDVISLDLARTPVTAEGLKELKGLKNLQTLNLQFGGVTDGELRALREIGLLHALVQAKTQGFERPARTADVTRMDLVNTKVTADGLKELKGLKNLRTLDVGVTDGVLRALREIGLLHALVRATAQGGARPAGPDDVISLTLVYTAVTVEGLKELKELKNLEALFLGATKVTDEGLKELKSLKNLQTLSLASTPVTDAGLKELRDLKNLQKLSLAGTHVTDAGLKDLNNFTDLRDLNISRTNVTKEGVEELRKALPKCTIH
jgi:Leucine-rich repeat (LRR) protein